METPNSTLNPKEKVEKKSDDNISDENNTVTVKICRKNNNIVLSFLSLLQN